MFFVKCAVYSIVDRCNFFFVFCICGRKFVVAEICVRNSVFMVSLMDSTDSRLMVLD